MHIRYYFRNPAIAHSIHRVFRTLISEMVHYATLEKIEMPTRGSKPWDVVKNNIFAFRYRDKSSIHHITGHIHDILLSFRGCKTVLTIHDIVFIDNVKNPIKRLYKWMFWLYLPVKIADKVVCISNTTKTKVDNQVRNTKTVVIYNPLDTIYKASPKAFNTSKPVILHIGTGWNKNLKRTIEALEGIPCHLRIVGRISNVLIEKLEKSRVEYSTVTNLTDEAVYAEYVNCDIVNFPSLYEGFGMPIIEAQATGRVVITSNIEPLLEVSGDAVQFVDPQSVSSIRAAYLEIINNAELRAKLIEKGFENVKRFDVKHIAGLYMEVYKALM